MPDSKRIKLAALWLAGLAVVGLVLAGAGALVLSMDSGFGTVNDLEVANGGNATLNVTVEATPANDSLATFSRTVTLAPNESAAYADPLVDGEKYELTIGVEGGTTASKTVTGPGGACGVRVAIRENVSVKTICA